LDNAHIRLALKESSRRQSREEWEEHSHTLNRQVWNRGVMIETRERSPSAVLASFFDNAFTKQQAQEQEEVKMRQQLDMQHEEYIQQKLRENRLRARASLTKVIRRGLHASEMKPTSPRDLDHCDSTEQQPSPSAEQVPDSAVSGKRHSKQHHPNSSGNHDDVRTRPHVVSGSFR
jgi:hypothetical protein